MNIDHLEPIKRDFLMGKVSGGAIGMNNLFEPLSPLPRSAQPVMACHVLLTDPYRKKHGDRPFSMPLHEQWTARLSALLWKRYNGPIRLITDKTAGRYIREIGLAQVYDEIWDDLEDSYGVNPEKFWAAGKLLAIERMKAPCMLIDMDLLVWQPLELQGKQLVTAHIEHLNDDYYPSVDYFLMSRAYRFPRDWDYAAEPLNTSLFYIGDESLRKDYLREAFRFMKCERDTPDNGANCMIFAEQRILAMCARRRGIEPVTLLDFDHLGEPQPIITHTWSGKYILGREKDVEEAFISCCKEKCSELIDA